MQGGKCYSNFVCVKMKGNACNTYAIHVVHRSSPNSEGNTVVLKEDKVCKPHVLVSGSLNRGQAVDIRLR